MGERVQGRRFSVELPDGWAVQRDWDGSAFVLYETAGFSGDLDDLDDLDQVMYRSIRGGADPEAVETYRTSLVPEYYDALMRQTKYTGGGLPCVDDWLVEGVNCSVRVYELFMGGDDSRDFYIEPEAYSHNDYLRMTVYREPALKLPRMRELAIALARTVELDEPLELDLPAAFERLKSEPASREELLTPVLTAMNFAGEARSALLTAEVRRVLNRHENLPEEQALGDDEVNALLNEAKARAINEANRLFVAYGEKTADMLEAQFRLGTDVATLLEAGMQAAALVRQGVVLEVPASDPEMARAINALIEKPEGMAEALDRLDNLYRLQFGEKPASAPGAAAAAPSSPEPAPSTGETAAPRIPIGDGEPVYLAPNGTLDHDAACWLFYKDVLFFKDNGFWANEPAEAWAPGLFEHRDEYMRLALDLLRHVEGDEGLRIPEDLTAFRGGVNGIALFNFQAMGGAIAIRRQTADSYAVNVDTRLARGIAGLPDAIARLIWDLREFNGIEAPFDVSFTGLLNFDADLDLPLMGDPVPGAVELPASLHVAEKPVLHLPSAEELAAASTPWACGFEEPNEMQADEQLFEGALMTLCRDFPLTVPIEGTHHAGRAERIEGVHVGDPLILRADWQNEWYSPCAIEVLNVAGESLGYLKAHGALAPITGYRELACLLPRVVARVKSVTPLSQRGKNAKYALLDVRMELEEGIDPNAKYAEFMADVVPEAKAYLFRPAAERGWESKAVPAPKPEPVERVVLDGEVAEAMRGLAWVCSEPASSVARACATPAQSLVRAVAAVARRKAENERRAKAEAERKRAEEERRAAREKAEEELQAAQELLAQKKAEYENVQRRLEGEKEVSRKRAAFVARLAKATRAQEELGEKAPALERDAKALAETESRLAGLESELGGLGVLAFARKREVKAAIEEAGSELRRLRGVVGTGKIEVARLRGEAEPRERLESGLAKLSEADVEGAAAALQQAYAEMNDAEQAVKAAKRKLEPPKRPASASSGSRAGAISSTWRDRRSTAVGANPVHMESFSSRTGSGSTFGYNVSVSAPTMTYRMDIDVSGVASAVSGAADFVRTHRGGLPISMYGRRISAPSLSDDQVAEAVNFLGRLKAEHVGLGLDGVIEQRESYMGLRNTYRVTCPCGSRELNLQQKVEGL